MSLTYLLDTNIVSEPLRPAPNQQLLKRMEQHEAVIGVASVVWHELLYGMHRLALGGRRSAIEVYLNTVIAPTFAIVPYDTPAAQWHAAERARLVGQGKTPPFVDGQIAAIARVNNLILVTGNTSDFSMFQGLDVENWFE